MKKEKNKIINFVCVLLLTTAALLLSFSAFAQEETQILRDIQITEQPDNIVIRVNFNNPVNMIRHFPPNAGEILQIQLDVTSLKPEVAVDTTIARRESLLPPKNDLVPLVSATYEGDVPGGPYLTLRFKFAIEFKLSEGDDGQSIQVNVKKDQAGLSIKGSKEKVSLISEDKLEELMAEAKRVLSKGDYGRSIQLLNKLLKLPNHKYTRESKELLGLARERKGQTARAKLEYKDYLRLYPKGEGSDRVRQRLQAINAKQRRPREKLKAAKAADKKFKVDFFGRWLQRVFIDQTKFDTTTTELQSLTSIINLSSRMNVGTYDIRTFFNAHDVRDRERPSRSQSRLNTLYVDGRSREQGLSFKVGRQSSSKGGVFGRFDGLWASYDVMPKWTMNLTFGKPVNFSTSSIDADKQFYGVSATLGTYLNKWDANVYYIDQQVEGITDRQAIGGDVRYNDKKFSYFNSLDYDVSYGKLNIFLLRGGWQVNKALRFNVNYSFRQSPLVFTSNALQQENVTSFKELQQAATEDDIRNKVLGITSPSTLYSLGATYQIDKNTQLNTDLSVNTIDEKPEVDKLVPNLTSPSILAVEKTGPDISLNSQLVASNYFFERDVNIVGVRLSDRDTRDTVLLFFRSRFPYEKQWRFGPRLSLEHLKNAADDSTRLKYTLSGKVDYRLIKKVNLDAELGLEQTKNSGGNAVDFTRWFLIFGYFIDF